MKTSGRVAVVTGAGSGLGRAAAERLVALGASVVGIDLENHEETVAATGARYVGADVADRDAVEAALSVAEELGPLRILVHCAGRDGSLRLVERDGTPGSLDTFDAVIRTNLRGTFTVLSSAAARMAAAPEIDGERGVCVLTASVAAYEGQIGQVPYAASKAGVVGMTITAARDLASRLIRVVSIAPGIFDTPMVDRLPPEVTAALAASVPHPARLGAPGEFAALATHIIENAMLNGETIRLDGAIRMGPR